MAVFILDAGNIKGIAHKFAWSRPVWIGTKGARCAGRLLRPPLKCLNSACGHNGYGEGTLDLESSRRARAAMMEELGFVYCLFVEE